MIANRYYRSAGLVRTWLFHPWVHEPKGGVVGRRRSVSHVVSRLDGFGWVPLGPVRARQGSVWSRMGPYISRTPIRDSRVTRQGSSGHIGFRRVSVGTLFWHDGTRRGSTDRSTVPYRCTIDVRTHTGPYGVPTGPPGARRDPADRRRHRRTPFHRSLPSLGGPQLLLAQPWLLVILCTYKAIPLPGA